MVVGIVHKILHGKNLSLLKVEKVKLPSQISIVIVICIYESILTSFAELPSDKLLSKLLQVLLFLPTNNFLITEQQSLFKNETRKEYVHLEN